MKSDLTVAGGARKARGAKLITEKCRGVGRQGVKVVERESWVEVDR